MTDAVAALDSRITRVENEITQGFQRIEGLLQREISDLKSEQIAELRKTNERLADDQRRLWDRLSAMENRETLRVGERGGQTRIFSAVGHFISAACGGAVTWLVTWLSGSGGSPPHH